MSMYRQFQECGKEFTPEFFEQCRRETIEMRKRCRIENLYNTMPINHNGNDDDAEVERRRVHAYAIKTAMQKKMSGVKLWNHYQNIRKSYMKLVDGGVTPNPYIDASTL